MTDASPATDKKRTRTPQINAVVRARADLKNGNYAAARRRVESYFDACRYNPPLLGWFGEVARRMHDLHTAGRYLLLCVDEGPEVEACVQTYLSTVGDDPINALIQTPRCARLESIDRYPDVVQARLRRLGLDSAVSAAYRQSPPTLEPVSQSRGLWGIVFFLLILLLFVGPCAIGAITIVRWTFDI